MFGFISELVALPIRVINVPLRVADSVITGGEGRLLSAPLSLAADIVAAPGHIADNVVDTSVDVMSGDSIGTHRAERKERADR